MKLRKFILFVALCLSVLGYSQRYEGNNKNRLGMKTAVNMSILAGDELKNPRPKFGYTAGIYFRHKFSKELSFQTEFLANIKGSNFRNDTGQYVKISLFYMDLPLYLSYSFPKDEHSILLGPQVGTLLRSGVFVKNIRKAHDNNLALRPLDLSLCAAYQMNGKVCGLQAGLKWGLLNINDGLEFIGLNPPTGNNGIIRNISLEFGLMF